MANEYTELEQLVNDVTSLDTARMTLRWALERLQNIEKEKADLKKNLTLAEETAKRLQVKEASLTDSYSSRYKTLEEKEDFYTKLEATMSLLGEGKLDIQQLLKKEAKLDSLRHSLEAEYADKFEELDRSQRSIIERWNARLLDVESQYAGRLAEAQKKYDTLRAELDADHQGRLTALQASFKAREKEFSERIAILEGSVRLSEEKVETRRRELEAEYLAKKRETEENYRKLKTMLEAGLDEKLRSMDSDHAAQVTSLGASWQAERSRLLEEQRLREEQFLAAQERIKEIENALAAQQETHHSELLKLISEKETAFRAQLAQLENEKAAKEQSVRELSAALEKRVAGWEAERAAMRADFEGRTAAMEAALKEREAELEKAYAARKEESGRAAASVRAELERELETIIAAERKASQAERDRAAAQLAGFEEERRQHIEKINALSEEIRAAQENFQKERGSILDSARRETDAKLETERANWTAERTGLERTLESVSEQFRGAQLEIVSLNASIRRAAEENAAREAAITGELVQAKAGFEKELSARVKEAVLAQTAALVEALEAVKAEKDKVSAALELKDGEIRAVKEEAVRAHAEMETKLLAAQKAYHAEKLEMQKAHARDVDASVESAVASVADSYAEKLRGIQEELARAKQTGDELAQKLLASEKAYHAEKLEMQKAYVKELDSSVESAVSSSVEAYAEKLRRTQEELAAAKQNGEVLAQKLLASEKTYYAEKLEMQKAYVKELDSSVESAVSSSVEAYAEKLRNTQEELARARQTGDELAQKVLAMEKEFHAQKLEMQKAYVKEMDATLEATMASAVENYELRLRRAQEELAGSKAQAVELSEKLLASEKAYHDEKLEMQKAQVRELDSSVESAVAAAVELLEQRLGHAHEELAKAQKRAAEEMRLMEEAFASEKARLLEDLDRRDRYIENNDRKLQELETEMLKYRQEASSELLRNISEQDRHFREAAAEEKARAEERVKQLEELVAAKEKLLADSDRFCRQKQLELDKVHADLNLRVSKFNEELFAQTQELSDREKALNEYRLKLEKDYAFKASELEQMKGELSRAILEYRGRK